MVRLIFPNWFKKPKAVSEPVRQKGRPRGTVVLPSLVVEMIISENTSLDLGNHIRLSAEAAAFFTASH